MVRKAATLRWAWALGRPNFAVGTGVPEGGLLGDLGKELDPAEGASAAEEEDGGDEKKR